MVSRQMTSLQCSVDQLRQLSLMFPDPPGSLNNMERTFNTLLSVTKKTVQKIFIQDLMQRNLQMKNTEYIKTQQVRIISKFGEC